MKNMHDVLFPTLGDHFRPTSYMGVPLKPSFLPPNEDTLNRASMHLKMYGSVTQNHVEVLLDSLVFNARLAVIGEMQQRYQQVGFSDKHMPDWTARRLAVRCCVAQVATIQSAKKQGLETIGFNTKSAVSVKDNAAHFLTHVTIPVRGSDGIITPMHYIIDPTFAQFMRNMEEKEYHPLPGQELCSDTSGQFLALELCQKGYIAVNEDTMALYLKSFSIRPLNQPAMTVLQEALKNSFVSSMVEPDAIAPLKRQAFLAAPTPQPGKILH